MKRVALLLSLLLMLTACTAGPKGAEVIVSAAASMTDALKAAQTGFEKANPTLRVKFNFGSSGALQQQIEQGAPVDLFISAAAGPMDALVKKGLVESPVTVATNKVVLIVETSGLERVIGGWDDLKSDQWARIAIGNPQHVPVGQYAKAVLDKLNLWGAVEKRLVLGEDVRQVLNYVESGDVAAGIVYSTDAATSKKVLVVAEAPAGSHPPVVYPMAVIKGAKNAAAAQAFANYLMSEQGKQVLTQYGFGQ